MIKFFLTRLFSASMLFTCCNYPIPNAQKAPCVNERTKETIIRWGDFNPETGNLRAYQFDGKLNIAKCSKENSSEQYKIQTVGALPSEEFCKNLNLALKTFDTIQTLHAPGTTSARFVEYVNPQTNTTARAIWNPQFKTYGSKEFRAVYDSLMVIIPIENRW